MAAALPDAGTQVPPSWWENEEQCVDLQQYHKTSKLACVLLTIVYVTLFITGVVGNAVTVLVTLRQRRRAGLQSRVSYHMVSLAVSDLLVLVIGVPEELSSVVWWPAGVGAAGCKLHFFLWEACTYATLLNIAAFSAERYLAVCHPFRARAMTRARTKVMLLAVWLLAIISAVPMLFAVGLEDAYEALQAAVRARHRASACTDTLPGGNATAYVCTNLRDRETVLRVAVYTCLAVFLLVLAAVAYMCREMVVRIERLGAGEVSTKWDGARGGGDGEDAKQQQQQLGERRCGEGEEERKKGKGATKVAKKAPRSKLDTAKRQSVLMLELVVLALAVCWLPFQATRIMSVVRSHGEWTVSFYRAYMLTHHITDCFFFLSSTVNPSLYCLSSPPFRHAFWQCLRCRFRKDSGRRNGVNVDGGAAPGIGGTGGEAATKGRRAERKDGSSHGLTETTSSEVTTGSHGAFGRGFNVSGNMRWGRVKEREKGAAVGANGPGASEVRPVGPAEATGPTEEQVQLVGSGAPVDESSV